MGQQRQGRVAIPPGPWSSAVAARVAAIVDAREGKRDQFAIDSGISRGRLPKLLDGRQALYLEDVESVCDALGIDVLAFLADLDVRESHPRSSDELAAQRKRRRERVRPPRNTSERPAAMDDGEGPRRTDPDAGR